MYDTHVSSYVMGVYHTHVANCLNNIIMVLAMISYTDARLDQVSINFSGFILAAVYELTVLISKCRYSLGKLFMGCSTKSIPFIKEKYIECSRSPVQG